MDRASPCGSESVNFLAHGKSGFNDVYTGIRLKSHLYDEEDDDEKQADVVVNDWTQGRKKGLLADLSWERLTMS